jgi:hypothetical protein
MELGRRNTQAVALPVYLLRLDLANNAHAQRTQTHGIGSLHLQAGLPAMRLLEAELQRAVDEGNNVHSHRFNRYIS